MADPERTPDDLAVDLPEVEALVRRLAETEAALQGLTAGQVDAVVDPDTGVPLLLRQAQAELRRSRDELEGRVAERTAELARTNAALRSEIARGERARRALQHSTDRLQIFYEMDRAILAAHSAKEIAEVALAHVRRLIPCVRASVTLLDREKGEMSVLAARTDGETYVGEGWRGSLGSQPFVAELRQGEVGVVEDVAATFPEGPLARTLLAEGVRACANTPLYAHGELAGSLNLGLAEPGPLAPEMAEVLGEVAGQLAVGIQQALLHQEVQHQAAVLEQRVAQRTADLQASEARVRAIFEGAGIGVAVMDQKGCLGETNPRLQEMLGYDGDELHGRPYSHFLPPEDVAIRAQAYEALLAGRIEAGTYREEIRYLTRDGEQRWGNATVSVIGQAEGQPRFAIAMLEDITEQKKALAALVESEKMATTGRLAMSLAHEINNPLQSVIGCLGLAAEQVEGQEAVARYLEVARREARRVADLVARLRDIDQPVQPRKRKPVDVKALVQEALDLSCKRCEVAHVQVACEADDDLPLLVVAPDAMRQVFLNLVLNAVEAMPAGGQLQINTRRTGDPPGVQVAFADTGVGIAAEAQRRLFDPFYSTKPLSLGLGLYVGQNIVKEHGGRIEVESHAGEGSVFRVWLPAPS
jgi:two-component system sensor kinase FixL